jgi:AraC-like DNA-binding protein
MIVWGINTIALYIEYGQTWSYILWIVTVLNIFFIANAVVYQGLKFPETFQDESNGKQKYEKNPLSDAAKEEYIKQLKEYMATHKPYLNPLLSLSDLAKELKMPSFVLSQVLNLTAKQNFYEFINNYRIEESKRLLTASNGNGKTILEILYQCGFNSKSVFNSAFRKYTCMTPSEFKKFNAFQVS